MFFFFFLFLFWKKTNNVAIAAVKRTELSVLLTARLFPVIYQSI